MRWTKPDFEEISLGMEATAYVNTDTARPAGERPASTEATPSSRVADARTSG